jgi:hypothetical protein
MIIAERKPLPEVLEMLEGCGEIMVLGCSSCAAVCLAGGEKEAKGMAEALSLHSELKGKDWSVSTVEMCAGCGDCVLHLTAGMCPIARCAKGLLNGPCGGSRGGKCEVSPDTPCVWEQIVSALERQGRTELLEVTIPPKDWRPSRNGGPRRIVNQEARPGQAQREWRDEP